MSRKAYSVWDYPSNTKTNPIPPTKSSQGRAPSNPTVAVPQGQTSQTTARAGSSVSHRGENARQNYTSPTRGRPTSNGAQQNSGKGNQTTGTTGTIGAAKPAGTTKPTTATKPTGATKTTEKPPYRFSYASAADLADMNEIMGVNSYTGEAQDVADDFLRQNGVSSAAEYQEKFFAEQEEKRKAQEERARLYRELYGSAEDEAEILGLRGGYTGDPNDVAAAVQREYGARNAEEFRDILQNSMSIWDYPDYLNRRFRGGHLTTLQDLANGLSYGAQGSMALQEADQAMAADQFNGGAASRAAMEEYYAGLTENQRTALEYMGYVDPTQFYYPQVYNEAKERHKDDVLTRAADWGDTYRAETDKMYDDVPDWLRRRGDKKEEKGKWYLATAAAFVSPELSALIAYGQISTERYEQGLRSGETREQARRAACAEGVATVVLSHVIGKGLGKLAEVGARQLSKVAPKYLEKLNRTLQKTPGGQALINALTCADERDAGTLTALISDSFANEVERVGNYSSREAFLNEESVTRMAGAVLEGTSQLLGLPGAGTSSSVSAIRDSREAVIVERAITAIAGEVRDNDEIGSAVGRIIQAIEQGEKPDYLAGIPHEERGNAMIFPPEYGIMYPDGKKYPIVVSSYSEAKPIIKQLGLPNAQAHHLAQDAIYRDRIPKAQGITISVEGDAIREPNSQHGVEHNYYTTKLEKYYEAGIKPTHRDFAEIMMGGMMEIGVHPAVRNYALDRVIRQLVENGIDLEKEIDRFPGTRRFKKTKNIGGEKTHDGQS